MAANERDDTPMDVLLDLLDFFERKGARPHLRHARHDTVSILVDVPGCIWEIDVERDGRVSIEEFTSDDVEGDERLADIKKAVDEWNFEPRRRR